MSEATKRKRGRPKLPDDQKAKRVTRHVKLPQTLDDLICLISIRRPEFSINALLIRGARAVIEEFRVAKII